MPELVPDWQLACERWGIGRVLFVYTPGSGVLNDTRLLESERGRYALRRYRHRDATKIARELRIISFAQARAVPAVGPLPLPDGSYILDFANSYYALFPWIEGRQPAAGQLTRMDAAGMGDMLGRVQAALSLYPATDRWGGRLAPWSQQSSIAEGRALQRYISTLPEQTEREAHALAMIDFQLQMLRTPSVGPETLDGVPWQLVHGDFHEGNILFDFQGKVSAVLDWEKAEVQPRAWEILRCLNFAFALDPEYSIICLDAYRRHLPITLKEMATVAEAFNGSIAHSFAILSGYYLDGNEKLAPWIGMPAGPPDFAERWQALRQAIARHDAVPAR